MIVTDRDGVRTTHTLKSLHYCSPEAEMRNNAPLPFWDTESDHQRLLPKSVIRVASVENDKDYDWDGVTYDDDDEDADFAL